MKRTKEEKEKWKRNMYALAQKIREMSDEKRETLAAQIGTITAEGHHLSVFNCCFLWNQAGKALAQVGGFRQWQRAGRQVKKGEHAAGFIFVPLKGKKEETQEPTKEDEKESMLFRMVPVFDISQTEELERRKEAA